MKNRSPQTGRYLAVISMPKMQDESSVFAASDLELHPTKEDGTPSKFSASL